MICSFNPLIRDKRVSHRKAVSDRLTHSIPHTVHNPQYISSLIVFLIKPGSGYYYTFGLRISTAPHRPGIHHNAVAPGSTPLLAVDIETGVVSGHFAVQYLRTESRKHLIFRYSYKSDKRRITDTQNHISRKVVSAFILAPYFPGVNKMRCV